MGAIQGFEDIEAWQRARELTQAVYKHSGSGPFAKDFTLRDQARRAAVSIMSNIAEGFERGGSKELGQHLSIAKGSTGELESHLHVALDQQYITKDDFDRLRNLSDSTKKLLGGFMSYLRRSDIRGPRYKQPGDDRTPPRSPIPDTRNRPSATPDARPQTRDRR